MATVIERTCIDNLSNLLYFFVFKEGIDHFPVLQNNWDFEVHYSEVG